MNKNVIALAALAVVGAVYWKRTMMAAAAASRPATQAPAAPVKNTNSDMWVKLLGEGWKTLLSSETGKSLFGKNSYGQLVTSDGKPISDEMVSLLPNVLGDGYTPELLGVEYYDAMFPTLSSEYWF